MRRAGSVAYQTWTSLFKRMAAASSRKSDRLLSNQHSMQDSRIFGVRFGPNVRKILANAGWMSGNQIVYLAAGVPVTIWMARYMGPSEFGTYSYVLALTGFFQILCKLGLDDIVVRELVRDRSSQNRVLGTAFALKAAAGLLAISAVLLTTVVLRSNDAQTLVLVAIAAIAMVPQAFETIDFWLLSELKSKWSFVVNNLRLLIGAAARVCLLLAAASLLAFIWVIPSLAILSAVGLVVAYRTEGAHLTKWHFDFCLAREMLTRALPLMLSAASIAVYMRIDQVMLGALATDSTLGIYAAAVRLSEFWFIVPVAIAASAFPTLIETRNESTDLYNARLRRLFRLFAIMSYGVCIPGTFLADGVVKVVYGAQYRGSGPVLAVLLWAGPLVALGVLGERWKIIENLTWFSFLSTGLGALANVGLNALWIPAYGALGAAWATVVSYLVASVISCLAFRQTRPVGRMMLRALALVA